MNYPDPPAAPRSVRPFVEEIDGNEIPDADPAAAPVVDEISEADLALQRMADLAGQRRSGFARLAIWVFTTLFTFVLSVAAWDFTTSLFARNAFLGWVAFVLIILAVLVALIMALREALGFARIARLDHLRHAAAEAHQSADLKAARGVCGHIRGLYQGRPEVSWGLSRFEAVEADVMDADALMALAETTILAPLDTQAVAEVEAAARRVALVTALVPLALADVAAVLYSNLAMIRRIAAIYGGRAGFLGSWSLMRRVFSSLLAAGAVSLADDLMGSALGGGVLSKLSRRFGEGVVNGALTARIGVAAMEQCRPLPFRAVSRPGVSGLITRALAGLVPRGKSEASES
ncbi:TIGR01620 family protein [Xinfangfangia sp. D13-10-4-6]|uniref:YcjF family protein n=1 Tax=Pseudogemmobacter hezensis TaxID=2737662 RepID=UPI001554FFDE|nr:TIGR01620 family protein [Pseudogemmobacter hezensis]